MVGDALNSLRNFVLVIAVLLLSGCASSSMMTSSALKSNEIRLSDYKFAVIYDSKGASFMELELEELMEANGLKVIGSADGKKYKKGVVIGTRYTEDTIQDIYGGITGTILTITLEDYISDKTLLTVRGQQSYLNRKVAWKQVSEKLQKAMDQY